MRDRFTFSIFHRACRARNCKRKLCLPPARARQSSSSHCHSIGLGPRIVADDCVVMILATHVEYLLDTHLWMQYAMQDRKYTSPSGRLMQDNTAPRATAVVSGLGADAMRAATCGLLGSVNSFNISPGLCPLTVNKKTSTSSNGTVAFVRGGIDTVSHACSSICAKVRKKKHTRHPCQKKKAH